MPVIPVDGGLDGTTEGMNTPLLVVLGGLPGTGKTTVAGELLSLVPELAYVRIDSIEQALRDSGELGPRGAQASGYLVGCAVARDLLASGTSVLVECVNPLELTRRWWRDVAESCVAGLLEVELHCSDSGEHRYRVENRSVDVAGLVFPTWQAVQAREYEDWADADLRIDTTAMMASEAACLILQAVRPRPEGH